MTTQASSMQTGLFTTTFALSSLLQAGAGLTAAKIAKRQGNLEAQQIKLNALSREADRKDALSRALSSANAASGTKGIAAFEGSPLAILDEMERSTAEESTRDKYMSDLASTTAKYRGRQSAAGYQSQAASSLLGSAGQYVGAL